LRFIARGDGAAAADEKPLDAASKHRLNLTTGETGRMTSVFNQLNHESPTPGRVA
jgi:hypothetical protein